MEEGKPQETASEVDARRIRAVLNGKPAAFGPLVETYTPKITRIILAQGVSKDDVEDVVQDTFIRAYRSLDRFTLGRRFDLWLAGVAVRAAKDHWRRRNRRKEDAMSTVAMDDSDEYDFIADRASEDRQPVDVLLDAEARCAILNALGELTADQKTTIVLFYFEEMSIEEIRTATGWSTSKVKVLLHRGRSKLRKHLEPYLEE